MLAEEASSISAAWLSDDQREIYSQIIGNNLKSFQCERECIKLYKPPRGALPPLFLSSPFLSSNLTSQK